MEFKQDTIENIIESENQMVLRGYERYGDFCRHALDSHGLLKLFNKPIEQERHIFVMFYSQIQKHHLLAYFSALRLHHTQVMMNLRQVLEAGVCAAYAIANPDRAGFADAGEDGLISDSKNLAKKRYRWLEDNFKTESDRIKNIKKLINTWTHSNIINTHNNFRANTHPGNFFIPFFDIENEYFVKVGLWLTGSIAISLMDLFYGVNLTLNVIKFTDDFSQRMGPLRKENDQLMVEMKNTKRYKNAQKKD